MKPSATVLKTERETAERDALRKENLADMRASFKQQLDATYVQTADGAKIKTLVLTTNEELEIARDTYRIVSEQK